MIGMMKESAVHDRMWLTFVKSPTGVWLKLDHWFDDEEKARSWFKQHGFTNVVTDRKGAVVTQRSNVKEQK